jgi:hypothetical protein
MQFKLAVLALTALLIGVVSASPVEKAAIDVREANPNKCYCDETKCYC